MKKRYSEEQIVQILSHDTCNREYVKRQSYCQEQRKLLRELEDLKVGERQMYELDDGKDQVMTVLKLALTNLAMWVRDRFFPPEYAHATWSRLAPFFRLPGEVVRGSETVTVDLGDFNDRRLSQDLASVADLVNGFQQELSAGRRVLLDCAALRRHSRGSSESRAA